MAIIKCEKGHFYDDAKYQECPHCKADAAKPVKSDDDVKTIAKISGEKLKKNLASFVADGDSKTVGVFTAKGNFNPVVGWLVCTEGPERGRDYRITSGRNFIGRSYQMDITISDDPEISRENHCSVVYDPKSMTFNVIPGTSMAYHNNKEILSPTNIAPYDKIVLGGTTLQVIPYCKEGVSWE